MSHDNSFAERLLAVDPSLRFQFVPEVSVTFTSEFLARSWSVDSGKACLDALLLNKRPKNEMRMVPQPGRVQVTFYEGGLLSL